MFASIVDDDGWNCLKWNAKNNSTKEKRFAITPNSHTHTQITFVYWLRVRAAWCAFRMTRAVEPNHNNKKKKKKKINGEPKWNKNRSKLPLNWTKWPDIWSAAGFFCFLRFTHSVNFASALNNSQRDGTRERHNLCKSYLNRNRELVAIRFIWFVSSFSYCSIFPRYCQWRGNEVIHHIDVVPIGMLSQWVDKKKTKLQITQISNSILQEKKKSSLFLSRIVWLPLQCAWWIWRKICECSFEK